MVERLAVAGLLIGLAPGLVSRRQNFLQRLPLGTIAPPPPPPPRQNPPPASTPQVPTLGPMPHPHAPCSAL